MDLEMYLVHLFQLVAPGGYVNNNQDPCDENGNVNPLTEWWSDVDGDGYGSFIYVTGIISGCTGFPNTIPYFPGVNGNQPYAPDCNDSNINIYPGGPEICQNGIDEDCDGTADDGCSNIPNDNWSDATLVPQNAFPQCVLINGTCLNAAISPQGNTANVASGGGRDVWYKFVAPSKAVSIKVNPVGFDAVIELQTSAAAEVNVENLVGSGAQEILNFGNLTAGLTYYVGVRNFANSAGGTFTICISPLIATTCSGNGSNVELCSNYKPSFTGATTYTYTFTGTLSTPVGPTTATISSQIPLSSNALGLRYGGTYNVTIDANYALLNGLGATENITVLSTQTCSITVNAHASVEVRTAQRCPATMLRNSFLQGKPFVCGAQNFTVSFRRVSNCIGSSYVDPSAFEVTTAGASSSLMLNFTSPQALIPQNWYEVRWRPNFSYGSGTYGTARYIFIGGAVMDEALNFDPDTDFVKADLNPMDFGIYPNPNNGIQVNLNLTNVAGKDVFVRITDSMGRVVFTNRYGVEGSLNTSVTFARPLAAGFYLIEFTADNEVITERMIVER